VSQHRFNVYGRVVTFLAEDELCQYLADLFHESAMPGNGDVVALP